MNYVTRLRMWPVWCILKCFTNLASVNSARWRVEDWCEAQLEQDYTCTNEILRMPEANDMKYARSYTLRSRSVYETDSQMWIHHQFSWNRCARLDWEELDSSLTRNASYFFFCCFTCHRQEALNTLWPFIGVSRSVIILSFSHQLRSWGNSNQKR